jgi:hypothetical protein
MRKAKLAGPMPFTVLCQWHPGVDACDPWQTFAVALSSVGDAQDAANGACLFLIWKQMGQAVASLVIEGHPKLHVPDNAMFDAEQYDDTITFGAKVISCRNLG